MEISKTCALKEHSVYNCSWVRIRSNVRSKFLGNAEVYIMLALLIGLVTVVIGCWLSDNCWSPEPEGMTITVAWPSAKRGLPTSPPAPPTPIGANSSSSSSTTEPSSPESDWPLVDTSDNGDSMNLWHHALCEKNNSQRPDDREIDKGAVLGNGHACPLRDHNVFDNYDDNNTEHADTKEVTGKEGTWKNGLNMGWSERE